MDYPTNEDDPASSAAMNSSQQNAGQCPYRPPADSAAASASSQPGWAHPHFGGSNLAPVPMNAFYSGPNAYWMPNQTGHHASQAPRQQPYVSHQTHSSSSSNNSEYNSQEIRSREEAQARDRRRAQQMENIRPTMPRVFSSPDHLAAIDSAQGVQIGRGGQQQTASLTSTPSQIPVPNNIWAGYQADSTGRMAGTYYPQHLGFLPRPPQFGLQPPQQGQHPRQLPQPHITSHTTLAAASQARHLQIQGGPQTMAAYYGSFSMQAPDGLAQNDLRHRARVAANVAAALSPPEPEDSDEDSDGDEEDDEDTDSSPARPAFTGQSPRRRSPTRADAQAAFFAASEAEVLRERHRAARRAQLHNVKSIAHPGYIETLEKVDLKTLDRNELTCMICYNDFGVQNPEGIIEVAVRLKKCKHILGENCLKKWFEDSDSCPYCRDKVPSMQKRRARIHSLDPSVPGSSLLDGRYISLGPEERAAERAAFQSHYESHRFLTQYMGAQAGILGSELPRHFPPAEREEMLAGLRVNQERLEALLFPNGAPPAADFSRHSIPEYRERYERMLYQQQRHDDNPLASSTSSTYAARTVPQYERRRQARVRAASRGAINVSSGSTASAAPIQPGLPSASDFAELSRQEVTSSFDSPSSSEAIPRSITPHPTILDGSSSPLNANLNTLNPAAPAWNGMRNTQPSQIQPRGPPAAHAPLDSPSRAVFGYYQTNRGSMTPTPTRATDLDGWRSMPSQTASAVTSNNNTASHSNSSIPLIVDGTNAASSSNSQNGWQAAAQAAGAVAGSLALSQALSEGFEMQNADGWAGLEGFGDEGLGEGQGQGGIDAEMGGLGGLGF